MSWYWFFALPAIVLAFLSLRGERKRAEYVARRLNEKCDWLAPVTVIVPVKGEDEGLRENLAALADLDYPDYELLVAARQASDIPPGVLPNRAKVVLAHSEETETAEKIRNLQTAIRVARKRTEVLAFADSDGRVNPGWLRALIAPLQEEGVGVSTGYRWFTPVPPDFWSLTRSVWDAVAVGMLGPGGNRFAWGGAMAIRKETFFQIRVPEYWEGAVSDDYALSEAVRAAGLRIAYAPGALTPCFDHTTAGRLVSWSRRQMRITRVYDPALWWPALIAHVIYCAGMASSIAASIAGSRLAEWALLAQLSPGMLKGLNRAILAKAAMPEQEAWFKRHTWVHAIWVPLGTWLWLIALLGSAFGNTIDWRGRRYELKRHP
jgi:cellulose synthase/poly-beta-1,6-N-acetylglucosamine synthase-like glycosyltransferase